LISPVFKVIEVVPGYRELDISLWFLLFFSVFFGMLIGDAGYGLIYLVLTFWAQRKFGGKVKHKAPFYLF
jgi:V/A-type H+-transporting ATPase subunit I